MKRYLATIILFAGFSVIAIFGIPKGYLHAQTPAQYGKVQNAPLTSLKCNEFTFDATQSKLPAGSDVSFYWDFGDGTTSTDPVVTHTYAQSGHYVVNLSVTDNSGFECSTSVTSRNIRANIPPKASFVSKDRACVNESIAFDASTSYAESDKTLTYSWNFGDGTIRREGPHILKSYPKGGNYKVSLTVDDRSGASCSTHTAEKVIHINEPPVAQAGEDVILKCAGDSQDMVVHFDASATKDVNNDALTYIWDFGNGQREKGIRVSYRYDKTGHYDVRLIVSDNTDLSCKTDVDFVTVKLDQAPRADAGDDITVCANEEIAFDGSGSYVHKEGTALAQWVFGDGSSSRGLYTTHRYNRPGTYQAVLTLENKLNAMCPVSRDTRVITVNSPPVVNIRSVSSGCVGKEIFFDASSAMDPDGDNLVYHWNFGDGTTAQDGTKVSHTYSQGGNYRVSLIADDGRKTACSTATAGIHIRINTPPIADAGENLSCCVDKEAAFVASASSDPDNDQLTYFWDFGDGSRAQGETVTHAYSQSGSYNVSLTVDDRSGSACNQSTDSFTAVVKESPLPIIRIQ